MSGIALSSRIRLARNIENKPFPFHAPANLQKELAGKIAEAFKGKKEFTYLELESLPEVDKHLLVERHLISPEFAASSHQGGVWLTKDEHVSVMVNEEDHLRIQALQSGFALEEALAQANTVDEMIKTSVPYAYSEKLGYLTCCPTNLGTGMRASVMLHLPALTRMGQINPLMESIGKLGLTVRGIYGEGSQVQGDFYQVSNRITLGVTQQDIVTNVVNVCRDIIKKEEKAREYLKEKGPVQLADVIYRAYGILVNARLLSTNEFMKLISDVRMGAGMGYFTCKQPDAIDKLILAAQPAAIIKRSGQDLNEQARDQARAALVNKEISKTVKINEA